MKIYHRSLIGKRTNNEDEHDIILNGDGHNKQLNNINFFAVYDGHGGNKVSKYLKNNLSQYFMKKNIKYPLSESRINKIFDHLQKKLAINHKDFAYETGSTCLIVIIYYTKNNRHMHVINLGDCRAVICSNDLPIPLSKDHKPNWPDELNRIKKLGGEIYFDGHDYRIINQSVSRSFGDIDAYPYVIHRPDTFKYKLSSNDKFIILACDGLWDVMENHEVINFILSMVNLKKKKNIKNIYEGFYDVISKDKRQNLAKVLAEYAISKGSTDNITIIIIFL
jgi:serine/threonine protein phosphatase PrpC